MGSRTVTEQQVKLMLDGMGVLITNNHFVLTANGDHSSVYVDKDKIYFSPTAIKVLSREIAVKFQHNDVQVVIAPTGGGCTLSNRVAEELTGLMKRNVFSIYADKNGDGFEIRRGYGKLIAGKRVLAVEDVLTTGRTSKKIIEATRANSGIVIGLGTIWNRGDIIVSDFENLPRLASVVNVKLDVYNVGACPLCIQNVSINTEFGHGAEFLARKGQ